MRKQDAGFGFHRYRQLLAEAVDETKRLAFIDLLIEERAKERLEAHLASDRDAMTATTIGRGPGAAKAAVRIVEYASMSCPHCAAFEENVFPMLRSKYIDTGKVRFVFREFPLDIKAAAASMLARCIAGDDAEKYFSAIDTLFKQQDPLMAQTKDTLKLIGGQAGMSGQAVEACEDDYVRLDQLSAGQNFAHKALKVDS